MIGDSWDHDIVGANNVGIKCIWLNHLKIPCPDSELAAEIKSLEEVKGIIFQNF
jgi:putative hydrolase of the HAD superfamily